MQRFKTYTTFVITEFEIPYKSKSLNTKLIFTGPFPCDAVILLKCNGSKRGKSNCGIPFLDRRITFVITFGKHSVSPALHLGQFEAI